MNDQFDLNDTNRLEEQTIDLKALLMKYLVYWPWFVGGALAAVICCYAYLRYQSPVYNINASVLIKEEDPKRGGSGFGGAEDIMQNMGMFSMVSNFDNELEVLKSRDLARKVVTALNLYVDYVEPQTFSYPQSLYKKAPVQVWMTPEEADNLVAPMEVKVHYVPDGVTSLTARYVNPLTEEEEKLMKEFSTLPGVFTTPVGTVAVTLDTLQASAALQYEALISQPTRVAAQYSKSLTIDPTSKNTSIAQLNLQSVNVARGKDFINQLVAIYNSDANDDKNEVATKTAEFIEERIHIINSELGSTERRLADYKQGAGLTNLAADAQLALQENSAYNQKLAENTTQLQLISFLREYINDNRNTWEVIPSNVGLSDAGLSALIEKFNQMLIERKRLLRTSSESNPAVVTLDESIRAMRANVTATVESVEKGLRIAQADLNRQTAKYESRISNAPKQERELVSITRQQEIKANLYLMLLQKREENAITLAAIANNGRIINQPMADEFPVAPKKKIFLLAALLVGLFIPAAFIYLRDLLRFKIENRGDVEALTALPVVGDIPAVNSLDPDQSGIVVHENQNEMMEEVYRVLRTNLLYMLSPGEKVILFTSTHSGEGKSFNIANLAVSMAFMGKKVVVVGLDIRRPGLNKVFGLSTRREGITRYLADPSVDLLSLCQPSAQSPNLCILPGGVIPPNPTELVSRQSLDQAIETLKAHFDYVLLDTAPIGMVTDTRLIARVADLSVYVCRADYTRKSDFAASLGDFSKEGRLPKPCVLLNGVNLDKRANGSYYGYGKYGKYAYVKKYNGGGV